jgi:hypothetical protein
LKKVIVKGELSKTSGDSGQWVSGFRSNDSGLCGIHSGFLGIGIPGIQHTLTAVMSGLCKRLFRGLWERGWFNIFEAFEIILVGGICLGEYSSREEERTC